MNGFGMLWFDSDKSRSLIDKINNALDYYERKFGERPTCVTIHPSMMKNTTVNISGVKIELSKSILPNYFWVGTQ